MSHELKIRNYGNKLACDSFVHITVKKGSSSALEELTVVDAETGDRYPCRFLGRIDQRYLADIETVFCMMSHNCTRQELFYRLGQPSDDVELAINIFQKIKQ